MSVTVDYPYNPEAMHELHAKHPENYEFTMNVNNIIIYDENTEKSNWDQVQK